MRPIRHLLTVCTAFVVAIAGMAHGAGPALGNAEISSTVEATVDPTGSSIRHVEFGLRTVAWTIDATAQFDTIDELCFDLAFGDTTFVPEGGFYVNIFWERLPPPGSEYWWAEHGSIRERIRGPITRGFETTVCGTNAGAGFDELLLPLPTVVGVIGEDDPGLHSGEDLALSIVGARLRGSRLTCAGQPATIVGTEGDDTIKGTMGADVVVALGGDDDIRTLHGDDLVCAGDGDDSIDTGHGDDLVRAGAGKDSVVTRWGKDVVYGDRGDDWINLGLGDDWGHGGDDDDSLVGHSGDDVLVGGAGSDELRGWKGDDTLWESDLGDDPGDESGLYPYSQGDGYDRLWGGPGSDLLYSWDWCRDPNGDAAGLLCEA